MKKIVFLYYIFIVIGFFSLNLFLNIEIHETTHLRNFEVMGCKNITQTLFSTNASNCPNVDKINELTAQTEMQYMDIWNYAILDTIGVIIILILLNTGRNSRIS